MGCIRTERSAPDFFPPNGGGIKGRYNCLLVHNQKGQNSEEVKEEDLTKLEAVAINVSAQPMHFFFLNPGGGIKHISWCCG